MFLFSVIFLVIVVFHFININNAIKEIVELEKIIDSELKKESIKLNKKLITNECFYLFFEIGAFSSIVYLIYKTNESNKNKNNNINIAKVTCQCNDCVYYNDEMASRCYEYPTGRPIAITNDSTLCKLKRRKK